jgi:hypothetical protein
MIYTDNNNMELTPQLQTLVDSELQSGESITWMDQPLPNRMARSMIPIVLIGIPFTAFAIFWTVGAAEGASAAHAPGPFMFFPLFGIPFIIVGLGMLSSPFWVARAAKNSVYVLTNRRAIIFKAGWYGSVSVRSFEAQALTDLQRNQNADGSGDLIFAQDIRRDSEGHRHSTNIGFLAIRDVKSVEAMVRALAST